MTNGNNKRQFSTASIRVFADKIDAHLNPNAVDAVLNTLANLDQQIHDDFHALQRDLADAREENDRVTKQFKHLQEQYHTLHQENQVKNRHVDMLTRQLSDALANVQLPSTHPPTLPVHSITQNPLPSASNPAGPHVLSACDCRPPSDDASPQFFTTDHAPDCALRRALLTGSTPHDLCDLLMAREDACRNQKILISRLKDDKKQLKVSYDHLWDRYQVLYETHHPKGDAASATINDQIDHLSVRVQKAGQAAVEVATIVEERLKLTARDVNNFRESFTLSATSTVAPEVRQIRSPDDSVCTVASQSQSTEIVPDLDSVPTPPRYSRTLRDLRNIPDEYDADPSLSEINFEQSVVPSNSVHPKDDPEGFALVTNELMQTMALQQDAHEKLRATVLELTAELNRIDPKLLNDANQCKQQLQTVEGKLDESTKKLKKRDAEILDLRRQLTKVIAEYEAISVAHSYSNAELSKIRATNREKTRHDRQAKEDYRAYPRGHLVLEGVENRHHRKIHFR